MRGGSPTANSTKRPPKYTNAVHLSKMRQSGANFPIVSAITLAAGPRSDK